MNSSVVICLERYELRGKEKAEATSSRIITSQLCSLSVPQKTVNTWHVRLQYPHTAGQDGPNCFLIGSRQWYRFVYLDLNKLGFRGAS